MIRSGRGKRNDHYRYIEDLGSRSPVVKTDFLIVGTGMPVCFTTSQYGKVIVATKI